MASEHKVVRAGNVGSVIAMIVALLWLVLSAIDQASPAYTWVCLAETAAVCALATWGSVYQAILFRWRKSAAKMPPATAQRWSLHVTSYSLSAPRKVFRCIVTR